MWPVISIQRLAVAGMTAMPPAEVSFSVEKSTLGRSGCSTRAWYSVLTPVIAVNFQRFSSAMSPLMFLGSVMRMLCPPVST
jgi:hypothetical protein